MASLDRLDENFTYHQRALLQYRSTVGDTDSATGDACYKVAGHYLREQDYEQAQYGRHSSLKTCANHCSSLLEQALDAYHERPYLRPQVGRTRLRLQFVLLALHKVPEAENQQDLYRDIYRELKPDFDELDTPSEADFDRFAAYDSR